MMVCMCRGPFGRGLVVVCAHAYPHTAGTRNSHVGYGGTVHTGSERFRYFLLMGCDVDMATDEFRR